MVRDNNQRTDQMTKQATFAILTALLLTACSYTKGVGTMPTSTITSNAPDPGDTLELAAAKKLLQVIGGHWTGKSTAQAGYGDSGQLDLNLPLFPQPNGDISGVLGFGDDRTRVSVAANVSGVLPNVRLTASGYCLYTATVTCANTTGPNTCAYMVGTYEGRGGSQCQIPKQGSFELHYSSGAAVAPAGN